MLAFLEPLEELADYQEIVQRGERQKEFFRLRAASVRRRRI